MKLILSFLCLISMAYATDQISFNYTGEQNEVSHLLRSQKYRTVYEWATQASWCSRRICPRRPACRNVCRGNRCRRVCSSRPMNCRIEQRRCFRDVRVPRQIHEYDVDTYVNITFEGDDSIGANEKFNLYLNEDQFSYKVDDSQNFLLLEKSKTINESQSNGIKTINVDITIEIISAKYYRKLHDKGLYDVSLKQGLFSFAHESAPFLSYRLKILKSKRVGADIILYDNVLADGQLRTTTDSNGSLTQSVNLDSLISDRPSRMRTIIEVYPQTNGYDVLNKGGLNSFSTSANWLFKY